MTEPVPLDDRLWNLATFSALEATHPPIYLGLKSCLNAFERIDLAALQELIAAPDSAAVLDARKKGEAALHTAMIVGGMLAPLVVKVEKAVSDSGPAATPVLLTLLEAARHNRDALLIHAPAAVAEALASSPEYQQLRSTASSAVQVAADQLEAMRQRSADPATPYAELQPLVDRLKALWTSLDRSLAPLSRQQQETLRRPLAQQMTDSARALTRNLYRRKWADRAAGRWPPPVINPGGTVPEQFAAALASANYSAATTLLAPWVAAEWPAARLKQEMERALASAAEECGLEPAPRPGGYDVGTNPLDLAELIESGDEVIPEQVNEANFRGWWPSQIMTEEEDAWLTDVELLATYFVIVTEVDGRERIGFVRFDA